VHKSILFLSIFVINTALGQNSKSKDTVLEKEKSITLKQIVVEGKKPPITFKVDRQIFKASQFSNASSGTGIDVIRNLPSVSVNGQGDISFRGSSCFLVLINGKPTQGDASMILSQLSAASIENIEVITSPSAAFDSDGKAGIINIITKTGTENGLMVQTNLMGGLPPLNDFNNRRNPQRYGVDFSAGYRMNKWDISGGLNYLRNDIAGQREGDVYTIINNIKTRFPSLGERSFNRYNYGGRFSASYTANKYNTVSFSFYNGKKYQSRVADILYNNTKENIQLGTLSSFSYFNENDQQKSGQFTLANLDYVHEFNDASKIIFSGLFENADLVNNVYNNNIRNIGSLDTLQYTKNQGKNPLNAYRIKADYNKKLGTGVFQMGYQYRYDKQSGEFLYQTKLLGTNSYILNPEFTSKIEVKNNIHAGYIQYSGTSSKLSYNGGLRLENSKRDLSFSNNSETKNLSLTNLFPSALFKYQAWKKGGVKMSYTRRIKRTNNFELNPLPEREHSETLEQGDAELLPELTSTFETGFEQTFAKGSFYATAYYQDVKNPIQRVNKVFNDTILNRVFTNAGRAKQVGIETNYTYQINKIWSSLIGGNIYRYGIKGTLFNNSIAVKNSSWVYSINATESFSLPQNWLVQLSINFISEKATAQGEDSRFLTPHLTIKKTSKDKRWNGQLQWLNLDPGFNQSNRQRITTYGSDFYSTTNYVYEVNQLQLSIGYNLTRKNRKINLPVSEIGEKEF
jgi:outer membrane receptor protein involved in Fe transport